jgi:hypothetical protein
MATHGEVVDGTAFASWVQDERSATALAARGLPSYSRVYYPDPPRRAG